MEEVGIKKSEQEKGKKKICLKALPQSILVKSTSL
jgi:hypothetical protein